ncbi:MAG: glutamate synthase, partial [Myxococcota bacterium]|nr:glutamate synthase [Myxococcota bacterium]
PIPFATLVARMDQELAAGDALYGMARKDWWVPDPERDVSLNHLGTRIATPAGPASGPHTQLAQNLVLSFLGGGRFMELKTVQVDDELVIPRPCIHVPHIGYNVEWSQELRVPQSAAEYAKGWMLLHMLASEHGPGLWPGVDTIFDISLGYNLDGIRTDKVRGYLDIIHDAGPLMEQLRSELPASLARWRDVVVPDRISDTVTLSTFHGCPAHEIEAIATQTLEWGLHTVVKLNPTLLGHDRCRAMLDAMGYDFVRLNPEAFECDLQWEQLMQMIPRLEAVAAARGLELGVKFTNTLVCHSEEPPFGEGEMYLSGPPLHVLSFTLASEFRQATHARIPITFSAGVDAVNFPVCVASGLGPVTSCSDLLKVRGYARMTRYVRNLEKRMAGHGVGTLDAMKCAESGGDDPALAGAQTLARVASELLDDPRYHRAANAKAPRKVGTDLVLFDCLTCDKCIPVCPNNANFELTVDTGEWATGTLTWDQGAFELEAGPPLVVAKRHQIGTVADACNLCGQCDPWCPED